MVEALYDELEKYYSDVEYAEIDFSRVMKLARGHKNKKNYEEAIRAYREISEVIAENMDYIDDSNGYYGECFTKAVDGMVECIKMKGIVKKPHITYMFEKFLLKDPDYFADNYEDALYSVCTSADDLAHWEKILDPHVPDTIPDSKVSFSRHFDATRLVDMKKHILDNKKNQIKSDTPANYYRHGDDM